MGFKLSGITVTFIAGSEPRVALTILPSGTDTTPTGNFVLQQSSIDQIKEAALALQRQIGG